VTVQQLGVNDEEKHEVALAYSGDDLTLRASTRACIRTCYICIRELVLDGEREGNDHSRRRDRPTSLDDGEYVIVILTAECDYAGCSISRSLSSESHIQYSRIGNEITRFSASFLAVRSC
jgi:hypothetical protein